MTDIEYTPGPLLDAARNTPTALWNDSSDLDELRQSISYGGVGATCNPVIAYTTIKKHLDVWAPRIQTIADAHPTWGESEIGWQAVKDMSQEAAKLLEPVFDEHKGRNGRLSVQTDPRFHRDAKKLADQAEEFHNLARNIVVKIPADEDRAGGHRGRHPPRRVHQRDRILHRRAGHPGRRGHRTRPEGSRGRRA